MVLFGYPCYADYMNKISAEKIIQMLDLQPLPVEGGWFRQSWVTEHGTAIYYLITPDDWSVFHRLTIPEIWHFYAGDPVRQFQILPDGEHEIFEMGTDLEAGQRPQIITPADSWQATRLTEGGDWALLGTTMAPPYTDECIEFKDAEELSLIYPDLKNIIEEFK